MKKLYTILLTVATLALFFSSCKEEVNYQPGEPETGGCYGVYFPAQVESLSLDPSDPTVATITVARTNTNGAITVPYTVTGATDIFSASDISFADGQSETTCNLTFNSAEVGVPYTLNMSITDPLYASKYNAQPVAFDFTVMRDKWNSLGKATFIDTWMFGDAYEAELIQNDKDRNLFRLLDPLTEGLMAEGYYPDYYKAGPSEYIEFRLLQPGNTLYGTTISIPGLVYFKTFNTGYYHTGYSAEVQEYFPGAFKDYPDESGWLHNKVVQYQDNGLPAAVQLAPFVYMVGVGGWDNSQLDGQITIIFPGAILTDYSLSLEAGLAEEGVLPVEFTLGTDVAEVKYAIYEGTLNAAQVEKRVGEIADGAEASAKSVTESGVVGITLPATGVYTLVAVVFDGGNAVQGSEAVGFSYVAKGEEVPVVANCGLNITDKYYPLGYTSENSAEFYVYGEDITSAKIGLFGYIDYMTKQKAVIGELMESDPVDDETIEKINGDGWSDLFVKLSPGTKYVLLVWVTNGYESKIITAQATTNGDPKPIYMNYTADDIILDLSPAKSEGLFGKYNFYAVDNYNTLGVREKLGEVTISDSAIPDAGPDDDGLIDEYVTVKGIFGAAAAKYGFDDSMVFDYYGGVLYTLKKKFGLNDSGMYGQVYYGTPDEWGYDYDFLMIGGFVSDGHIAFVTAPENESYGFNGIGLFFYKDEYVTGAGWAEKFSDLLFVIPDKDQSGVAPQSSNSANLQMFYEGIRTNRNFVETPKGQIRSAIDRLNSSISTKGEIANTNVVVELPSVSFEATHTPSVKRGIDKNAPIEVAR